MSTITSPKQVVIFMSSPLPPTLHSFLLYRLPPFGDPFTTPPLLLSRYDNTKSDSTLYPTHAITAVVTSSPPVRNMQGTPTVVESGMIKVIYRGDGEGRCYVVVATPEYPTRTGCKAIEVYYNR